MKQAFQWTLVFLTITVTGCKTMHTPETAQLTPATFNTTLCREVSLDYLLYLPAAYNDSEQDWPLVLFLHGAGERGSDLEKLKLHGPPKLIAEGKQFPFILAAPQCPQDGWWTAKAEDLAALVDFLIQTYRVDASRVYVTGLSMGGFGMWSLITQYPDKFAAAVPICGGGDDVMARFRLRSMPVWVFHGAKDPLVPLQKSEVMVNALRQAGNPNVKFTVYPDAGHDSWTETYNNPEVYQWLLSHQRTPSQ